MEGNEIEKAAEQYYWNLDDHKLHTYTLKDRITIAFTAGANWQKERENKQLRTEIYVRDSLTAELTHFKGGYNAALDTIRQLQAELTRAHARIEELTSQNLELIRKYDDLYSKANGQ